MASRSGSKVEIPFLFLLKTHNQCNTDAQTDEYAHNHRASHVERIDPETPHRSVVPVSYVAGSGSFKLANNISTPNTNVTTKQEQNDTTPNANWR